MKDIQNSYFQFKVHASSGDSSTPISKAGMVGQPIGIIDYSLKRKFLWRP
jgi:hypothetical protein